MDDTDDPLIKSMIYEEFKNLEHEEKEKEKCKLELKRLEAKVKASVLWKKMKEIKEQKAAEEKLKQQKLRQEEETRQECEEEKQITAKQHEMRLRQQFKEKYMKDMEKEKESLEMQKIKGKYGSELLCEVRKDMGLPTLPVLKMLPSAGHNPTTSYMETSGNTPMSSSHHNLSHSGLTPSGLLAKVKHEKYDRSELGGPDDQYNVNASPCGEKQHLAFSSEEPHTAIGKIRRMLCRFACVNCMNFAEVHNQELSFVSHVMFPFYLQLESKQ